MKNIQKLFDLTPKIRAICAEHSGDKINLALMELFSKEIPDFESELRKAFDAYSVQGFYASPQVNSKKQPLARFARFFDWSIVNVVRRTNIEPTNHQLISLDTSIFFIQYLISGGFKSNDLPFINDVLEEEFMEAFKYIKSVK